MGGNVVLFGTGVYLLRQRKGSGRSTIIHFVSASILFGFATMLAVVETALVVGQLFQLEHVTNHGVLEGTTASGGIDLKVCNTILFIGIQLIDLTAFLILLYRCYMIYNRNWKIIVGPVLLILADTGVYSAALPIFFKNFWANLQSGASMEDGRMARFSNAVTILNTISNGILTILIAGKIWIIKRRMRQLVGQGAPGIHQKYNTLIAMTLESGLIIPVSLVANNVFIQTGNMSASGIVSSCLPQLLVLAPLLILVRAGLGLTTKASHMTLQAEATSHDTGEVFSPPLAVSVTVAQTRSVASVGSSEAQINRDVKPGGEYV
ncbi:hypothetical protein VNI00_007035 [Paramarasmius palmivorus]|uniref:CFEM domain-containing protein n=1 Tax=Paramarasmius palmivorus TaxID=297713 RepID=A0AAW0D100_9AGAR